jgi:hypothetical protein
MTAGAGRLSSVLTLFLKSFRARLPSVALLIHIDVNRGTRPGGTGWPHRRLPARRQSRQQPGHLSLLLSQENHDG